MTIWEMRTVQRNSAIIRLCLLFGKIIRRPLEFLTRHPHADSLSSSSSITLQNKITVLPHVYSLTHSESCFPLLSELFSWFVEPVLIIFLAHFRVKGDATETRESPGEWSPFDHGPSYLLALTCSTPTSQGSKKRLPSPRLPSRRCNYLS